MKPKRQIRLPQNYIDQERAKGVILPEYIPVQQVQECEKAGCEIMKDQQEKELHEQQEQQSSQKIKPKRRFLKWIGGAFLRLFAVILILMLIGFGILISYLKAVTVNDFLWLDLEQLPHQEATILYAQNRQTQQWEKYATLNQTQQRIWVPLSEIPLHLQQAFIAIEDRDFYTHHGVSWKRTIFAMMNEVKKIMTGTYFGGEDGMKQGASTINQQLIKNLIGDDETGGLDGYMRKIREIWRAYQLDKKYEKSVILEAYLNIISFTGNTAGVQAESLKLFNKPVSELTLEQCATIAAITKNPSRYDPVKHPEQNLARRNYILKEMWQQDYITQQEYEQASQKPLGLKAGVLEPPEMQVTSWFTDQVIKDVLGDLQEQYGLTRSQATDLLYNGGFSIYTTVDPNLQAIMEEKMTKGRFFERPSIKGSDYVYDENGKRKKDENGKDIKKDIRELPQAAMVSVDYEGRLAAVVGGLDEKEVSRSFNRGTDALRQVGSTMKAIGPYVTALEQNKIHWSSQFLDAPVRDLEDEETGKMKPWPANVTQYYTNRNLFVADALAQSVNTVAVRVGETVGSKAMYDFVVNDLHITSLTKEDEDLGPLVLGSSTYGITPYELAGAYMIFGSGGKYTTLHSYESVKTGYGKEILAPKIETTQVISEDTAWVMNRMLKGVMQGAGTASGLSVKGEMESIGKTGTSSDNRDFWFVGATPYYVTATWYGYDSGASLNVYNGTHAPAQVWRTVMYEAQKDFPVKEFVNNSLAVELEYCTDTGERADQRCYSKRKGWYRPENIPPERRKRVA